MSGDAEAFSVSNSLTAYEGDEQVFHRTWNAVIPRTGV
jgi:hypothetical protein